ncbi:hypothetical protein [Enterococcus sp. LJL90]
MNRGFKSYLGAGEREAGYNISWGAIFAGVVTFFALFFTLSLISSAIGFGMTDPTAANPLDGVGTGVLIWTAITLILSFFGGGFVAGMAERRVGLLHGFLSWAASAFVLVLMLSYLTVGVFSAVGSLFGNITGAVTEGVGNVASTAGDLISDGFDEVANNIDSVDVDALQTDVEAVLTDTDIPELQPDYLRNELAEATTQITDAGRELLTNPNNSDQIIDDLSADLEERAMTIGDAIDEDAIANAVSANTSLTQQEAQEATTNIVTALNTASEEAQTQIENARDGLAQARDDLDEAIQEVRETADDATDATASASIWAFVAMVVGLVLTSVAGMLGANFVKATPMEDEM